MDTMGDTIFASEYCMGIQHPLVSMWVQHSLGWGIRYLLVNNVRWVRYSLEYRIHSDTCLGFKEGRPVTRQNLVDLRYKSHSSVVI